MASSQLEMVLVNIRLAARDTNLYTFETCDGGALPPTAPGAHVTLHLPNGLERQYSLVEADAHPTSYTVGVKRDPASRGGSAWIHDHLKVGMRVTVDQARNNFPLNEDAERSALFAGGIGITPIFSMATRLAALGRTFDLHYSCRTRADAAFLRELGDKANVHLHIDDEQDGRFLPIADLVAAAPQGAHLYCCGPTPMLAAFEAAAVGRPAEEVHVEYFTQQHEAATSGGFTVVLARSQREFLVPDGKTILQTLQDAGVDAAHSCEEGICGACETRVIEGVADHRDSVLSQAERSAGKTMMICCSGAISSKLILDL